MENPVLFQEIEPAVAPADGWRAADAGLGIVIALGSIVMLAT
ncbi:hypothetical protein EDF54_1058 [Rathayibacter sp. PhB93]|jgi:hypothetical protein|nr:MULTISPECIES: hypothetical protein [unclassified Rathayibacter]ROQ16177.1 hypothetical protein EDF54_1058 [Rathayibacter sp. PhB93]TDQ16118.1 hypothetical protein EDF17_0803 [Rathayibacter sp. PhB1]